MSSLSNTEFYSLNCNHIGKQMRDSRDNNYYVVDQNIATLIKGMRKLDIYTSAECGADPGEDYGFDEECILLDFNSCYEYEMFINYVLIGLKCNSGLFKRILGIDAENNWDHYIRPCYMHSNGNENACIVFDISLRFPKCDYDEVTSIIVRLIRMDSAIYNKQNHPNMLKLDNDCPLYLEMLKTNIDISKYYVDKPENIICVSFESPCGYDMFEAIVFSNKLDYSERFEYQWKYEPRIIPEYTSSGFVKHFKMEYHMKIPYFDYDFLLDVFCNYNKTSIQSNSIPIAI